MSNKLQSPVVTNQISPVLYGSVFTVLNAKTCNPLNGGGHDERDTARKRCFSSLPRLPILTQRTFGVRLRRLTCDVWKLIFVAARDARGSGPDRRKSGRGVGQVSTKGR